MLCGISQAGAETWTDDNGINWTFDVSGTNATNITPTDKNTISGEVVIPGKVYNGESELTVTSIGQFAFSACSSLTSVTIPEGVTSIGNYVFSGCSGLTSVTISEGVTSIGQYAFSGSSSLTSVTLPSSVTSIGGRAFQNCTGLTSVTIPSSLTSIGNYVFNGCSNLIMVKVLVTDIAAFINNSICEKIKSQINKPVMLIDEEGNEITEVIIPSSVTSIGSYAFYMCSGLTSVTIPSSVTSIGQFAFSACSSLTSVTIPEGVTSIGNSAFYGCSGLTSLTIPEGVTNIGEKVFESTNLMFVTINVTNVPSLSNTNAFPGPMVVLVPESALDDYLAADTWKDISVRITSISPYNDFSATVSAQETSSGLHAAIGEDNLKKVISLKITGSINSYDIMIIRNKMLCLRHLDLSEASIVACDYEYITGCKSEDNVVGKSMFYGLLLRTVQLPLTVTSIGDYAFDGCSGLASVTIPEGVTSIGYYAFLGCSGLTSVTIPEGVTSIGNYAFWKCSGLTSVTIPEGVTSIGEGAFSGCSSLKSVTIHEGVTSIGPEAFSGCKSLSNVVLPSTLVSIPWSCFNNCSKLTEIRIPPMVTNVGASAFSGCTALKDYYVYVVDPISVNMSSFANYTTATLHVPTQSYQNYYWNTQWSQFANLVEFDEPYSRFYIQNDYTLADDKRFDGEPDADFHENSGFIVDGNENQDLGDIHVIGNGTDAASIIDDGNITAQNVFFDITIAANKWYFFAFPFRVKVSDIVAPGYYALRWYDGEARAQNGQGGWKDFTGEYLEPGIGYIFQCNAAGTLNIPSTNPTFDGQDKDNPLTMHHADNSQHASWNFMGNPWLSYFDINDCEFDAPFTIWNGSGYDAYRPGDDDYLLHPFQAFFVQKPEGNNGMHFGHGDRYTYHQGQNHQAAAHAKRMAKGINPQRLMLNLTISDGTNCDRTRVVFNADKQNAYEVGTDAAKFMTVDMPQLYTLDGTNTRYAINERPQGEVKLGFNAPTAGTYTITMQRMDQPMLLRDMLTGRTVSLTDGDYTFDSEAGTFDNRFMLVMDNGTTGIAQLFAETGVSVIGADGGLYISGANKGEVNVYNTAGALVAQQAGNGHTALPRGAYIVKVNGVSVKVAVK